MKELKISDIVEAFKSLKIKSPIISVDKDFYHWLRLQELDGIMSHKIN